MTEALVDINRWIARFEATVWWLAVAVAVGFAMWLALG